MRLRMASLALVVFIAVGTVIAALVEQRPAAAALPTSTLGRRLDRAQFGAVGSTSFIVWEDRAVLTGPPPRNPKDNPVYGI